MKTALPVWGALLAFGALWCAGRAVQEARSERAVAAVGRSGHRSHPGSAWAVSHLAGAMSRFRFVALAAAAGTTAAAIGLALVGPLGVVGAVAGPATSIGLARRAARSRARALERQLAEVAEAAALAVRSGLSVSRALEFAAGEVDPPMAELMERFQARQRVGVPFEQSLHELGEAVGSDDAKLFVLVVSTHARSGGSLAQALEQVSGTIRHRIGVRRDLRALSAQGRISGAILGALPVAFMLVLAVASHRRLGPVYRSPAGMAMVGTGLAMEGLAYGWIRRLLRVDA